MSKPKLGCLMIAPLLAVFACSKLPTAVPDHPGGGLVASGNGSQSAAFEVDASGALQGFATDGDVNVSRSTSTIPMEHVSFSLGQAVLVAAGPNATSCYGTGGPFTGFLNIFADGRVWFDFEAKATDGLRNVSYRLVLTGGSFAGNWPPSVLETTTLSFGPGDAFSLTQPRGKKIGCAANGSADGTSLAVTRTS